MEGERLSKYLIILALGLGLMACAGGRHPKKYDGKKQKGFYTTVKTGETLWEIARENRVTAQQIAEWNNIQDPDRIRAGMRIFVPKTRAGQGNSGSYDAPLSFDRSRFNWPVRGNVMSGFGMRDGNHHDGIDIKAASGTPIYAASDGTVVYVGNLRGYGNLVIIRHADRFHTTYAHNQKNMVKVNQRVDTGATIALVGSTGRSSGPHLHFEVRLGATPRNPLFFLPTENNAGSNVASEPRKKESRKRTKPVFKKKH